ncbi:unnamed protein product [Gordionus sp. m RMFG-2023]|uniref:uncharacterized protein LOC135923898 isoform X2 n=1 Tax=Gordionus sp. m RMFG-2023 TaxID=3053472 RepID=UPI0030E565FD
MVEKESKYSAANVDKIIHFYDLNYIPKPSIRHIRIFISSHHEEFEYERHLLTSILLPDLQNFCSQYGYDVEFLNFNAASHIDPYYDSQLYEYSYQCLEDCFVESKGVFFVGLIGEKDGTIPVPANISTSDMEVLTEYIKDDTKKMALIQEWYSRNNINTPFYSLENLSKAFPFYYKSNPEKSKSEQSKWVKTHNDLVHLLRQISLKAFDDGKIDAEMCVKTTLTLHLEKALTLSSTNIDNHCVFIVRENFKCQDEKLKKQIKENPHVYHIPRSGKMSNMLSRDKSLIENVLLHEVSPNIRALIQNSILNCSSKTIKIANPLLKELYKEILIHLNHWKGINANIPNLVSQLDILNEIKNVWCPGHDLKKKDISPVSVSQRPIILLGGEGCGKSSFVTQLLTNIHQWFPRDKNKSSSIILRYVGLTPKTLNVSQLLRNLCLQIYFVLNQEKPEKIKLASLDTYNLINLIAEFNNLLKMFADPLYLQRRHLFLIIEDFHHVYKPSWTTSGLNILFGKDSIGHIFLPDPLPPNVHIVFTLNTNKFIIESTSLISSSKSTTQTPNTNQVALGLIIDDLKAQFGSNSYIISLDQANFNIGKAIDSNTSIRNPIALQEIFLSCYKQAKVTQEPRWMQHSLKQQHQMTMTLPNHQKNLVNQALLNGKLPLYAFLVAVLIKDWPSEFKPIPNSIPNNIVLVLKCIMEDIEINSDRLTLSHVLKYISSAHLGITEVELLDLLSSNKPLMEIFYGNALNINNRFPYFIWANIKRRLALLFSKKVIDGKILFFWNHKIICDITKIYSFQRPVEKTQVHCDMANLFLETIYLSKETSTSTILPSTTIPLNFREITSQPLLYNEYQYNMRRIYELWFHLLYTGDIKLLKFHALCNFDYLMSVVHGATLGYLFHVLDKTLQRFLDYEIQTLCSTLVKSVDILSKDHLQIACEIIGCLRNVDDNISPYLDNLVIQAMEWCDSYTLPLLVPLSSWLAISTPDLYDAFTCSDTTGGLSILAPSSQHILMTTKFNQVHMYHLGSHEFIRPFKGLNGTITALVIAYNSSFVACATSGDLNINFWKIEKNEINGIIKPHDKEITCLILSLDDKLIFSGSNDCKICWSAVSNYEIIRTINAHRGPISGLVINSFGEVLASSSEDKTVKVWLIETGNLLNIIEDITYPVKKIILSHDDIYLGILCQEFHVQLRALTTGTFLYRLDHKIPITDMCFTIDTRFLILGCKDTKIYLYNVHSQTLNYVLTGHTASIRNTLVTMNNDFIVSTSQDGVFVWNIKKPTKHDNILTHKGIISCIKISKDGSMAITGSEDGGVKVWNLEFSELQEKLPDHAKSVTCVNFSPNSTYIVSGSRDTTINIKQLNEASSFIRFTGHTSPITNAVFSLDEKSIISSEFNDIVKVWRVETGFTLLNCSVPSRFMMVTPNSLFAISGNRTNSMKIWNVEDGSLVNSITHGAEITCLSITPNSQICVTGSKDESLKVWEVSTGKLTQVLVGHEDAVTCVTTSHNNQKVITGGKDNTVIMWNIDTGSTLQTYDDHTLDVTCVAITQDSSIIISSALDGTLRVWNSSRGSLITLFDCHYPVLNFCMSPDASHLIVRLNDPHVLLMCLHNSPATEYKSHTQLSTLDEDTFNNKILPIKMKLNRNSLYLGKNLIPKISTTNIDQSIGTVSNLNNLSSLYGSASINSNQSIVKSLSKGPMSLTGKGPQKLLRKQDSMSKIFFQTHHPFPCSPKMSDLIPDMNMEAKDKLTDVGVIMSSGIPNDIIMFKKNILLKNKSTENNQGQAIFLKTMTCTIQ